MTKGDRLPGEPPGAVYRAIAATQKLFFDPPDLSG
jgi:hypothetical protein